MTRRDEIEARVEAAKRAPDLMGQSERDIDHLLDELRRVEGESTKADELVSFAAKDRERMEHKLAAVCEAASRVIEGAAEESGGDPTLALVYQHDLDALRDALHDEATP